ncbi:MAG: glycerol-3-phosphate 1-O-acyltransferase PlsY [Spirosomataceae bacterium]
MTVALYVLMGYLLGSIPTAVWYGRVFHGIDIRKSGSGNAGATNSLRVLGKKAGMVVLVIDILKGFGAVFLAQQTDIDFPQLSYWVGIVAVVGHLFPLWAQFRGGKGVATSLGVILALFPAGALGAILVFLVVTKATKYVSLASLSGPAAFIVATILIKPQEMESLLFFGAALWMLLIWTHRQNIQRLIRGQESKLGQGAKPVPEMAESEDK